MVSLLGDCCCAELDPCLSKEEIIYHDGWTDYGHFSYNVYSRSGYFEVVYYTTICTVDCASLRFTVNKVVGVTSDTVSIEAYNRLLTYIHYVSDYFAVYHAWQIDSNSPDRCSELLVETYTMKNIHDYYRNSTSGAFYYELHSKVVKKYLPYDYPLPQNIIPVGCEGQF